MGHGNRLSHNGSTGLATSQGTPYAQDGGSMGDRMARQLVEARYREAVENAVEGVFRTTPGGRFLMANRALARMLGYESPEQLIAERTDLERQHYCVPAERARFQRLVETQGFVNGFEYEACRRDGTTMWLRSHGRAVRKPDGTIYYEGTVEDITNRRRADALLELRARERQHLLQRAISAQEEERTRVARELHDETGQALSAILVGLRNIEDAETIGEARTLAHRLRELTAHTVRDVGRIARGLRPSTLDDLGLLPALQRYGEDLAGSHDLTVRITGDGRERYPPNVETTLYRIVQEALTNVARHARARSADVIIRRHNGNVRVTVQDDGAGFDVRAALDPASPRRTLGLIGIQERASLLGGHLAIDSRPTQGTMVSVELPIESSL
jgi:PAS domain S-box-containing protein